MNSDSRAAQVAATVLQWAFTAIAVVMAGIALGNAGARVYLDGDVPGMLALIALAIAVGAAWTILMLPLWLIRGHLRF